LKDRKIRKAIFPVAGLGTRFLPATKSIPKEIMTLIDRPLIQYAIDEAREAGIEEFIFVTSRGKSALEDYFDESPALAAELDRKNKTELAKVLESTNMDSGAIAYIRQTRPMGLGHAVWCARRLIGDEAFAVILPDDVIAGQTSCLKQMVDAYQQVGGNMVAAMEVPKKKTSDYGILGATDTSQRIVSVNAMVEKPSPETAPSNLAVIGRYILTPNVLSALDGAGLGVGGEVQLTDAIAKQINADGVYGYRFEGQRFDCGSKAGYLQATVAFGLAREDLRDELMAYLSDLVPSQVLAS
jgi:UTP--glucose-1-phosphate uridylyltransferase